MVTRPLSTLLLKSLPAVPLFRFASSPRPLVPRLGGSPRPGASRSSLAAPPLTFRSATRPQSSRARSSLSRLLHTSRTAARWFLFASSPSPSAATWPGILSTTSLPLPTCSRSLATLSLPPANRSHAGGNPSLHHHQCMHDNSEDGWHRLCTIDSGRSICGVLLFFALLPAVPLSNQAACVRRGVG